MITFLGIILGLVLLGLKVKGILAVSWLLVFGAFLLGPLVGIAILLGVLCCMATAAVCVFLFGE